MFLRIGIQAIHILLGIMGSEAAEGRMIVTHAKVAQTRIRIELLAGELIRIDCGAGRLSHIPKRVIVVGLYRLFGRVCKRDYRTTPVVVEGLILATSFCFD